MLSARKFLDREACAMVHRRIFEPEDVRMTRNRTASYYWFFRFPGVCPRGSRRRMS